MLLVPAEGVAFVPSLTTGLVLAQAAVSKLATINPASTQLAIEQAEAHCSRPCFLQPRHHSFHARVMS